jgi:hypothetical protein
MLNYLKKKKDKINRSLLQVEQVLPYHLLLLFNAEHRLFYFGKNISKQQGSFPTYCG